ncbi:MAG: type II toxin-antitoxin system RelE/ParE family toxin [Proteobacteria bacterium]|nr:type II toxin-antitoxin system RelE/ParE family toxin [Pseudomonadota bacterium]
MQIKFTPESLDDLERLRQFLMEAGAPYAKRMANDIIQSLQNLQLFPRLGLPVQRAPDPDVIRDLYVDKYCVRYLITTEVIYILRVWHS